jgi:hypothetical protein
MNNSKLENFLTSNLIGCCENRLYRGIEATQNKFFFQFFEQKNNCKIVCHEADMKYVRYVIWTKSVGHFATLLEITTSNGVSLDCYQN